MSKHSSTKTLLEDSLTQAKIVFCLVNEMGVLKFVNAGWSDLSGVSVKDSLQRNINDFFHEEEHDLHLKNINAVLYTDKRIVHSSARLRMQDTAEIVVDMVYFLLKDDAEPTIGIVFSPAKTMYIGQDLFLQNTLLTDWMKDAPDIIYVLDSERKILFLNNTLLQILSYDEDDLRGNFFHTIIHPEDIERVEQLFHRQMEQGVSQMYLEFRMVTRADEWIWVGQKTSLLLKDEKPVGLLAIARDYSVQKRVEEELLASERRYWLAFETALEGAFFADRRGIIRYVNPAGCAMTGYTWDELIGSPFTRFIDPSREESATHQFNQVIESRQPLRAEFVIRRKLGGHISTSTKLSLIDLEGEVLVVVMLDDATDSRLLEKEVNAAHRQERLHVETLEEINKLKTRMLSAVSHEFRTPLSSIIGFTSTILETDDLDSPSLKKYLTIVHQQANRLARLVEEMLDLSLFESQKMLLRLRDVPMHEVASEVMTRLQESAQKKNMKLRFEEKNTRRPIKADRNRIEQVVYNVLDNAIKYSPIDTEVYLVVIYDADAVRIVCVDSGMGMSVEEIARAYESFYRSLRISEGIPGTGLGLTIAREIIHAHHGTIEIDSEIDSGTTVTITLPYSLHSTK